MAPLLKAEAPLAIVAGPIVSRLGRGTGLRGGRLHDTLRRRFGARYLVGKFELTHSLSPALCN
jgi:hypothetical protein